MLGVDVGGHDVRLDLVPVHAGAGAGVVDRVEDGEQLAGLVAVAERGEREDRPDGAVRVLPAVLADARQISLDVAGILGGVVEGWGEQQHEPVAEAHEELVDGSHRLLRSCADACSRQHGPRLGDRIDPAFVVDGRAERGSVVEERPAIPVAVPSVALQSHFQCLHVCSPTVGARLFARALRQSGRRRPARCAGTSQATRSRPCRRDPLGPFRRSSRLSPSGAGRGRRRAGCDRAPWRSVRTAKPRLWTSPAGSRRRSDRDAAQGPRCTPPPRRGPRCRR